MAPTTALALPPLATRLPDAEPSRHDLSPYWHLVELVPNGHDDYVLPHDYARVLAMYLAAGTPFSIQYLPGMEVSTVDESDRDWLYNHSLRYHPSLSAAERNA